MKNGLKVSFLLLFFHSSLQIQLSQNCPSNQYYNEYILDCDSCGESISFDTISKKCKKCKDGEALQNEECKPCTTNYSTPSSDGSRCIDCNCVGCFHNSNTACTSENGIVYDRNILGYQLNNFELFPITGFNSQNDKIDIIPSCIGGTLEKSGNSIICNCTPLENKNGRCYTTEELNKITSVITSEPSSTYLYNYVEVINDIDKYQIQTVNSALFYLYSYQAIADCSLIKGEKCQLLANLCTLKMYDEKQPECEAFINISNELADDDAQ